LIFFFFVTFDCRSGEYKGQETRNKKQETRNKKQETRNKKQEQYQKEKTRNKKRVNKNLQVDKRAPLSLLPPEIFLPHPGFYSFERV